MSNSDPHPLIRRQIELDGVSQHANVTHDQFVGAQQIKMLLHSPESRIKTLHDIDAAIEASDGTSLKAKSELFDLRKKLSRTHEEMLKAGR